MHQLVVERLMTLREPYRSTLLARYFEDLSHGEIAARDGVALATVRSRLQRGLAELRGDLGEEQHTQGSLLALLALQTWSPESVATQATRASAWIPWATAAAVTTGVGLFLLWPDPELSKPNIESNVELSAQTPAPKVDPLNSQRNGSPLHRHPLIPLSRSRYQKRIQHSPVH